MLESGHEAIGKLLSLDPPEEPFPYRLLDI